MRFQVPQFIEVESKIFGPLSLRQFVYLAGGAGGAFIVWSFLPKLLALPAVAAVIALALGLAFYKFNNKPFIFLIESSIRYVMNTKLYIWKKVPKKPTSSVQENDDIPPSLYVPRLSDSKLKDLSWSLDVQNTDSL